MSTRIDLPPERDLPTDRRRDLRAELLRAARPPRRRAHAWLVAVPVAVLAVVLGLVLTQPWDRTPPVVGVPSASPVRPDPSPSETVEMGVGRGRMPLASTSIPSAQPIDRGPLDAQARSKAIRRCQSDLDRHTTVAAVHLARRTSTAGDVVLFTGRDGLSYACSAVGASLYGGSGSKTNPLPRPTTRRPVVRIESPGLGGSRSSDGSARGTSDASYRVGPEVASLQLRVTVAGHTGPWFEASLDDGYAWATASVEYRTSARGELARDLEVEDRAFDVDGKALAIDRTPR